MSAVRCAPHGRMECSEAFGQMGKPSVYCARCGYWDNLKLYGLTFLCRNGCALGRNR